MIISSRKKFIFFHVPKVAGSSLNGALRKYADIPNDRLYNYLLDYVGPNKLLGIHSRHISPQSLRERISNKKFESYLKIAFVRNPYDWHVSQYSFHRQSSFSPFYSKFKNFTFEEYLKWDRDNQYLTKSNQTKFLSSDEGDILVDFIGKFENLEEDFREVVDKLNLKASLYHTNKSVRRKSYQEYYSEVSRKIVEEINAEDIKNFNYSF